MRQMKDSKIEWVGEIPENWEIRKIKYILLERVEKNNPIKTSSILSLTAKQGVIPYSEKEGGGNKPKEDLTDYRLAYPGDIVMNSMNILSGSVGLSNYFGCVSPVYYMLRPINSHEDVRFYNYIFQTTVFQKSLFGLGNGILMKESGNGKLNTIRMRIPMDKFGNLYIPIAPIQEQKEIAEYLDEKCGEIDALLADIKDEIETLEQYKRSVITESVTKGLNPSAPMKNSGIEWLGDQPIHWEHFKGKYIFKQRNERGNQVKLQLLSPTQNYGVIPQTLYEELSGMSAVKLNENINLSILKTIHKGDFCISLRSFQGGFEYSQYEGVVSPAYQVFYPTKKIFDGYYKYLFKEKSFIAVMNSYTLSLRDGKNIAFSDFGNTLIPYPPLSEQQEIAEYLDKKCAEIDAVISDKQTGIQTLESYKKSLIYEYVTGKKEVKRA